MSKLCCAQAIGQEPLSFSIVIPVWDRVRRGQAIFLSTLASVTASIDHALATLGDHLELAPEIILVDDASSDDSWPMLQSLPPLTYPLRCVRHAHNQGECAARNTGVNHAKGECLLFCDDDDLYLQDHVLTCLTAMLNPLPLANHDCFPGFVKTRSYIREYIHPDWHRAIDSVLTQTLCIRKKLFELLGGFPQIDIFKDCGGDDQFFHTLLFEFVESVQIERKTIEYIRYPGNALDSQLPRFSQPPGRPIQDRPRSKKRNKDPYYWEEYQSTLEARRQELLHLCSAPDDLTKAGFRLA